MAEDVGARIKYESVGADKAKADAKEVGASVEELSGKTAQTVTPTEELAESTTVLSANWTEMLGVIAISNPLMSRAARLFQGTARLANNLSKANLNLREAAVKTAIALRSMAGALKLLLVGGLVVATIVRVVSVIRDLKQVAEDAARSIRDQVKALDELQKKNRAIAAESVAKTEAESRGLIIPTLETQRRAEQLAGRAPERFKQQVADVVIALGDEGKRFSLREILDAIQSGFTPDRTLSEELNRIRLSVTNQRPENIEAANAREARRRKEAEDDRRRALQQAREGVSEGSERLGRTKDIEAFIDALPGLFGELNEQQTERLSRIVKSVVEIIRTGRAEGPGLLLKDDVTRALLDVSRIPGSSFVGNREAIRQERIALEAQSERFGAIEGVTVDEVSDARTIIRLMERAVQLLERPTVVNNVARQVVPSQRELQRLSTNGESMARRREP